MIQPVKILIPLLFKFRNDCQLLGANSALVVVVCVKLCYQGEELAGTQPCLVPVAALFPLELPAS